MIGGEQMGIIMDVTDGSSIVIHWPERLSGGTELEISSAPSQYRNAVVNSFGSAKDTLELEVVLMQEVSAATDVMIPLRWLQTRQVPGIVPGVGIAMPPARLVFFGTQMIPPGSEWEIVSGIRWETEGSLEIPTGHARKVTCTFTCHRVDETMSKFNFS